MLIGHLATTSTTCLIADGSGLENEPSRILLVTKSWKSRLVRPFLLLDIASPIVAISSRWVSPNTLKTRPSQVVRRAASEIR